MRTFVFILTATLALASAAQSVPATRKSRGRRTARTPAARTVRAAPRVLALSPDTPNSGGATRASGHYASITTGRDGLRLLSFFDPAGADLKIAHCENAGCTAATVTTLDAGGEAGYYSSLAIGADGLGLISYYDGTNRHLKTAHCLDVACTRATIATLDDAAGTGRFSSLAIGPDGRGLIAYFDAENRQLKVAHCTDAACGRATLATPETVYEAGYHAVLALDPDGRAVIRFRDGARNRDHALRCKDADCAATMPLSAHQTLPLGLYTTIRLDREGLHTTQTPERPDGVFSECGAASHGASGAMGHDAHDAHHAQDAHDGSRPLATGEHPAPVRDVKPRSPELPADASITFACCAYNPNWVSISTGQSVSWSGNFSFPHPLRQVDGPASDTPVPGGFANSTGTFYSVQFNSAGNYYYQCAFHGTTGGPMRGMIEVMPAGGYPGETPSSIARGTPLTLRKNTGNPVLLDFAWGAGCGTTVSGYAIYEGTLGAFYSHAPFNANCNLAATSAGAQTPGAGNRYYLIVPVISGNATEGVYGFASSGAAIPPGATRCYATQNTLSCP